MSDSSVIHSTLGIPENVGKEFASADITRCGMKAAA